MEKVGVTEVCAAETWAKISVLSTLTTSPAHSKTVINTPKIMFLTMWINAFMVLPNPKVFMLQAVKTIAQVAP